MMASMQPSAPPAITPFYAMPRPNAPIVLFRGRVDLADATATERHRGGIVLEWLPSPAVSVWARGAVSDLALNAIMEPDSVAIVPRTPDDHVPAQSKTTRGGSQSAGTSFETRRKLLSHECGDSAAPLSYALLHIANFPRLRGRVVTWPDGSAAPGRMVFESGLWRIVMDEVQDADAVVKELNGSGGFALTHTARVEQVSGGTFTVPALAELVEAFTFFCWLCTEARCGPVLPVGFDDQGHAVWSRWNPTVTESSPSARTWLDPAHSGGAEALFPLFMDRFAHPYWRQVLRHAIAYLIDAGRPSPVNRAIIMAQVLLEAVSYSWLVEERKLRTHDDFEHRTAPQNIREMLQDMRVPVAIPAKLTALATTQNSKGNPVDGPQALVIRRNEIVHHRPAAQASDYDPMIEAYQLGAWYCELAVLHLCGFTGLYRSRLTDNADLGAVEPVPWR
jgi:hypothetical protein